MKKITSIFPGQGSQKIGMGRDFYDNSTVAKEMVEEASDRIRIDFKKILFEENELINQTEYTQPAILIVSLIANRLFNQPSNLALGHSLGEFSAISSVGALDFVDAVEVVYKRGLLMKEASKESNGGMMVVMGLSDEEVERVCKESGKRVWPANYNSDGQIVVAGIKDDLIEMEQVFKAAGAKRALLLNMSVASHCPLMQSATKPLEVILEEFLKDSFKASVISNVTAKEYNSKSKALELLPKQLVKPVLYKHSIKNAENSTDIFIEFGEGSVLKGLNRRITKIPTISVFNMKSLEEALKEVEK
jgi:[acyl-carrier-protein] S-malonyltransferase